MSEAVLDASAILAVLNGDAGTERKDVPVVTAGRTWRDILPGIEIRVVR
jgi:PIN domain nuclease of toxin-antitoxin system